MPPPLHIPSKVAIHALRGIALGASCAIGVILEDQRRRISTLRTAVANKEKLKSTMRYHGMTDAVASQSDDVLYVGGDEFQLHWHRLGYATETHGDPAISNLLPGQNTLEDELESASPSTEPAIFWDIDGVPDVGEVPELSSSSPTVQTETSSYPSTAPTTPSEVPALEDLWRPVTRSQARTGSPVTNTSKSWATNGPKITKRSHQKRRDAFVAAIIKILNSNEEERLDRALTKFFNTSQSFYNSSRFDDEWIAISAQLSKACQAEGRLEDASKVLAATVGAGPLDEDQFYDHEPVPIIDFLVQQMDGDKPSPEEVVSTATLLFLAKFKEKPRIQPPRHEEIGRKLFSQHLMVNDASTAHAIYWRVFSLHEDPVVFTGWAMQGLYQHGDYRNVIKYFLLNYSKMRPESECFNKTVDCVVRSVKELDGWKAHLVLNALEKMYSPDDGTLRSGWIMRLLQAYWRRHQDFSMVKALFEAVRSIGLLEKIRHPEGVYRTMIEISIKAGEKETARSYYNVVVEQYPAMASDVALNGFVALSLAKAGDWDGVFDTFSKMWARVRARDYGRKEYDDAFVMVLKVFADKHPVAEIRDFISEYTSALGVRMHRYTVTMVANKYGECHDMEGFVSWLQHCSDAGFALDSSFVNSILYNCRAQWKFSYPELRAIYFTIRREHPALIDDVSRRIMSQAALKPGRSIKAPKVIQGIHSGAIAVNKLAYSGRTTNRRDIYEAMNQELGSGRPATAISIYRQAMKFGMPPCKHCLRLAVQAALRIPNSGNASALSLIQTAYQKGDDVNAAVTAFIKFQLDNIQSNANDILLHMRNLITRFEALHIILDPAVLTHMALVCTKFGHHERAVVLCTYAKDRHGFKDLCFSRQSIKALLSAYPRLLDIEGMRKLTSDLLTSSYAADKPVYEYLKSAARSVRGWQQNAATDALLDILNHTIEAARERRAENKAEGKMIAEETLRIMQDALKNMNRTEKMSTARQVDDGQEQQHRNSQEGHVHPGLIGAA